ncbi:MAG: hypothetical protein QXX30_04430 [Candidatus Aenigmatarchaeota archaeon]
MKRNDLPKFIKQSDSNELNNSNLYNKYGKNLYILYTPYSLLTTLSEIIDYPDIEHHILYKRPGGQEFLDLVRESFRDFKNIKINHVLEEDLAYILEYLKSEVKYADRIYIPHTAYMDTLIAVEYLGLNSNPYVILIEEGLVCYFDLPEDEKYLIDISSRKIQEAKVFLPEYVSSQLKSLKISKLNTANFKLIIEKILDYILKQNILTENVLEKIKNAEVIILLNDSFYLKELGLFEEYKKIFQEYIQFLSKKNISFLLKYHPKDEKNLYLGDNNIINIHYLPFEIISYLCNNIKILVNWSMPSTSIYTPKIFSRDYVAIIENSLSFQTSFEAKNIQKLIEMGIKIETIQSLKDFKKVLRKFNLL